MKILVVSDTHRERNNIKKVISQIEPDRIFHLGDAMGDTDFIQGVAECPVDFVRGNCDDDNNIPNDKIVDIEGVRFFLTHGHRYMVNYDLLQLYYKGKEVEADVCLFGHTHQPLLKQEPDIVIANPGSIAFPRQEGRKPSYLVMEITPDSQVLYSLKYL
jgi:putative phosphoesterase